MAIVAHILNSHGKFDACLSSMSEHAAKAIDQINEHLSLDADVCITHDPRWVNPLLGIGGLAFCPTLMHINFDSDHAGFQHAVTVELLPVMAHEAHHCKRMENIPDDHALIDSLVTEGLACQFELEVTGAGTPSFLDESITSATSDLLSKMRPSLESTDFCYDTYFLGKDLSAYPKYAGFAVGLAVVRKFLADRQMTAVEAASVPAIKFLPYAMSEET